MRESRNVRPALRADYSDKRDTKRIRPDQERETDNGNGKVDLMHGDLSERPQFDSVIHQSRRFLTGAVLADHPIIMVTPQLAQGLEAS
jgi:hypothetical protein